MTQSPCGDRPDRRSEFSPSRRELVLPALRPRAVGDPLEDPGGLQTLQPLGKDVRRDPLRCDEEVAITLAPGEEVAKQEE